MGDMCGVSVSTVIKGGISLMQCLNKCSLCCHDNLCCRIRLW